MLRTSSAWENSIVRLLSTAYIAALPCSTCVQFETATSMRAPPVPRPFNSLARWVGRSWLRLRLRCCGDNTSPHFWLKFDCHCRHCNLYRFSKPPARPSCLSWVRCVRLHGFVVSSVVCGVVFYRLLSPSIVTPFVCWHPKWLASVSFLPAISPCLAIAINKHQCMCTHIYIWYGNCIRTGWLSAVWILFL